MQQLDISTQFLLNLTATGCITSMLDKSLAQYLCLDYKFQNVQSDHSYRWSIEFIYKFFGMLIYTRRIKITHNVH